jgi:hypothetical protein
MNAQVENTTIQAATAPKLTRAEKLVASIERLKASIVSNTEKVNDMIAEYNSIAALAALDAGSVVIVKIGRKFADRDTTRFVEGVVLAVKEDEDGSKQYKVQYGKGFDAEVTVVNGAALSLPVAEDAPAAE